MTPLLWLFVMVAFVLLSLAALGLLDSASARIAEAVGRAMQEVGRFFK